MSGETLLPNNEYVKSWIYISASQLTIVKALKLLSSIDRQQITFETYVLLAYQTITWLSESAHQQATIQTVNDSRIGQLLSNAVMATSAYCERINQ